MSISSISTIIERASVASEESPLVVFIQENGQFDCVFADTIVTRCRMRNPYHLIAMNIDGSEGEAAIRERLLSVK